MFAPRHTLHAPHLLDVEVAQVIRRPLSVITEEETEGLAFVEDDEDDDADEDEDVPEIDADMDGDVGPVVVPD